MSDRKFPLRLRVMPDYASSGIWVMEPVGPFRHSMIRHEALGLPEELREGFILWMQMYWDRKDEPISSVESTDEFNEFGRNLAQSLKAFVGPDTYVEYIPELPDGGLDNPEVIE